MDRNSFSSLPLAVVTVVLTLSLLIMYRHLTDSFKQIEKKYDDKTAIVLNKDVDENVLTEIIYNNNYAETQEDAAFIASNIKEKLNENNNIPSLSSLQSRKFGMVPVSEAESCHVLSNAVMDSKKKLGQDETVFAYHEEGHNKGVIVVKVRDAERKCHHCPNVPVRLRVHYLDSMQRAQTKTLGFVLTDSKGQAVFKGLDDSLSYSVLPILSGYEYGAEQGTTSGMFASEKRWGHKLTYTFDQNIQVIPLFDNQTFRRIKADQTISVRTPSEFNKALFWSFFGMMFGWWGLYIVLACRKRKYNLNFDSEMIAAVMFLTGFCVLMMFSIQSPLIAELQGVDMAKGVLFGLTVVVGFQFVDFVKLYQNKYKLDFDIVVAFFNWLFLPYKRKVSWLAPVLSGNYAWWKKTGALFLLLLSLPFGLLNVLHIHKLSNKVSIFCQKLPKGSGWLLLAIFLTLLLFPFGKEVGGMRVNLDLKILPVFQPSEIVKYLLLFFMAAFFTQNAETIIDYSRPAKSSKKVNEIANKMRSKLKTLSWVIGGLSFLLVLYAFALHDLGPALVISVTFVLLYSLVKSKVDLENVSEDDKWKRIFTCDSAMLFYGTISFAAFMIVGAVLSHTFSLSRTSGAIIGAFLWLIVWIVFGLLRHKQFFETAVLMNLLVFSLAFGGQIMQHLPLGKDTAERLEGRTRMCVNTWGKWEEAVGKDFEQAKHAAVSNTQVANGLWALAAGGWFGQGLGEGNPNLVPAFNTDMILSSVGEQTGLKGLFFVLLALGLLFYRITEVGYKVKHKFAFYFCVGMAFVTGVQFFIIALGSSGIIPLTGITVPFLSYGRVSMILNLTAFGVVLSFSKNIEEKPTDKTEQEVKLRSVGGYNYPVSIVRLSFLGLAIITLFVWLDYCGLNRGNTLVHPAFVYYKNGTPLIEYNPRIALLQQEMLEGNIYDRKGVLLATSDTSRIVTNDYLQYGFSTDDVENLKNSQLKRYYPFGEHLFFMLGDRNTELYLNSSIGYMAESRHMSYMRGYDNKPITVYLRGKIKEGGRFLKSEGRDSLVRVTVYDYHDKMLVKCLKDGLHGKTLKKHNKKVSDGDCDLKLTIDAKLQIEMQRSLKKYVDDNALKNENLLRISVVVLDAANGDLLTSANYPLPDYKRLQVEEDSARARGEKWAIYNDYYRKNTGWKAYTDRDLGLTFQTAPGSTAKVMSAMAGLRKLGVSAPGKKYKYYISSDEIIEKGSVREPVGWVTMRDAIVKSSNCYFINLVNNNDLYQDLGKIYETVGISIDNTRPYLFSFNIDKSESKRYWLNIQSIRDQALDSYIRYKESGKHRKMNDDYWQWAWGQGTMTASPLDMARVTSAVVNKGVMPVTQYVVSTNDEEKKLREEQSIRLLSVEEADTLQKLMCAESANQKNRNDVILPKCVGGKTGTPERVCKEKGNEDNTYDDGWYIFFVEGDGCSNGRPLAVAVRIERGPGSGEAVRLTKAVVLKVLRDNRYIK
ncbi:MAG: FtsW/RodA/SpoVE family cell cycle protein [Bacteroidales bacterium]|nr:FtsW/RodA/SpoVE family cell cycle protein [Bacteroidales bacterium]